MLWGSFALALVVGMIVSAGLYVAYRWPDVKPDAAEGTNPDSADAPDDAKASHRAMEHPTDEPPS